MEMFVKSENKMPDINLEDFPFICRICLSRGDLKLLEENGYLRDLFEIITKIDVHSAASLPENICSDCIKTLEGISLFINTSIYNNAKAGKNFMLKNENDHSEATECETSLEQVIQSEKLVIEEYEKDLQYFKGFEICQICYSTNILKPVEGKTHLMQLFQNITNIDVKTEVFFSSRNCICNKCLKKLETISVFISESLCNEIKLKNIIETNEALETEMYLEGNTIDMTYLNKVKNYDDFDNNAHSYDSKCLHTSIDIKDEIVDSPEASIKQINSEENSFKDEFSTGPRLKNMLKGFDSTLESHSETNRFKCDGGNKIFTEKQSLIGHVFTHTGEEPFKCICCEKSFCLKINLQRDILFRTEEKRFECDCCGRNFNQKSTLQTHMLIHSREKPFTCDCCEKSFTRKSSLQMHMRLHTGEKPFTCDCCEKSFNQKVHLQKHMRIHTTEKPFTCNCCEKSFTLKWNLQRHMRIHTGEK